MKKITLAISLFASLAFLNLMPTIPASASEASEINNTVLREPPLPPQPRPPGRDRPLPPPDRPYDPPRRPPYDPDPRPWPPDNGYREETVSRYVGQRFRDVVIDVKTLLNLGWYYRGYELDRVEVRVRGADGRAAMVLFVNGWEEDSEVPTHSYNSLEVRGSKRIDREINSIDLRIDGTMYIEEITGVVIRNRW